MFPPRSGSSSKRKDARLWCTCAEKGRILALASNRSSGAQGQGMKRTGLIVAFLVGLALVATGGFLTWSSYKRPTPPSDLHAKYYIILVAGGMFMMGNVIILALRHSMNRATLIAAFVWAIVVFLVGSALVMAGGILAWKSNKHPTPPGGQYVYFIMIVIGVAMMRNVIRLSRWSHASPDGLGKGRSAKQNPAWYDKRPVEYVEKVADIPKDHCWQCGAKLQRRRAMCMTCGAAQYSEF